MEDNIIISNDENMAKKEKVTSYLTIDGQQYEIKNIPYADMLEAVREMVGDILVCDEDSYAVYERYDKEARLRYYLLKYFTDYPVTGDEDRDWKLSLVDRIKFDDSEICAEWVLPQHVYDAYKLLSNAVKKKFLGRNSITTKLLKTFGSVLGDEDIATTIAEGRNISENLLDIIQKAKLFDENKRDTDLKSKKQEQSYLKSFAKKDLN